MLKKTSYENNRQTELHNLKTGAKRLFLCRNTEITYNSEEVYVVGALNRFCLDDEIGFGSGYLTTSIYIDIYNTHCLELKRRIEFDLTEMNKFREFTMLHCYECSCDLGICYIDKLLYVLVEQTMYVIDYFNEKIVQFCDYDEYHELFSTLEDINFDPITKDIHVYKVAEICYGYVKYDRKFLISTIDGTLFLKDSSFTEKPIEKPNEKSQIS